MYDVFVLDSSNPNYYQKLDCEGVDFATTFAVADVSDIANRKDNITKNISLKGTKANNLVFGSLYHLNGETDFNFSNKLFFNFNSLRPVDCLVYENSQLLFKGSLRILEIRTDVNGNLTYSAVITGGFIELKTALSDKLLTDLDLSNLSHEFTITNLVNTWETSTQRFANGSFQDEPFQKGSGYVYPFVDYGYNCTANPAFNTTDYVNQKNLRAGIYVREYFDRIINAIPGYSYEIDGSPEFVERFNSLLILNNEESPIHTISGMYEKFSNSTSKTYIERTNQSGVRFNNFITECAIPLGTRELITVNNTNTVYPHLFDYEASDFAGLNNVVLTLNRRIKTTARVHIELSNIQNNSTSRTRFYAFLVARPFISGTDNNFDDLNYFINHLSSSITNYPSTVGLDSFFLEPQTSLTSKNLTFDIGEREYSQNTQFILKIWIQQEGSLDVSSRSQLTVNSAYVSLAKDGYSKLEADYQLALAGDTNIDVVKPVVPVGIKQMDFVKSVISLFNFYVFTNVENPKHLVFKTYDDYYAFCSPVGLAQNSLDWTRKIDYSKGFNRKNNTSLPKNYVFTYKDDSDYYNADYKSQFAEAYGTKSFSDAYGITSTKKVELIFSPTVMVKPLANSKMFPMLVKDGTEFATKKPTKTNIRILFYNGMKQAQEPWYIVSEYKNTSNQLADSTLYVGGDMRYPQVSTYYVPDTTATDSLLFSQPKKYWINATQDFLDALPIYQNYYIGQTSELTNPDVVFVDVDVHLTELDISQLDLRTPVFVDFGSSGYAYFKILSVEYRDNNSTSKVSLQKITI